jgi:hypothetical protein
LNLEYHGLEFLALFRTETVKLFALSPELSGEGEYPAFLRCQFGGRDKRQQNAPPLSEFVPA